jgi:hypothetical protein
VLVRRASHDPARGTILGLARGFLKRPARTRLENMRSAGHRARERKSDESQSERQEDL